MDDAGMKYVIKNAERHYESAAKNLLHTVQVYYPVGAIVDVESSTAGGARIHAIKIEGHGSWWHRPTEIRGVNVLTDRPRRFDASNVVRVIEMPTAGDRR